MLLYLAYPKYRVPFTTPQGGYIFRESTTPRDLDQGPSKKGNLASKFYDLIEAETGSVVAPHAAWTWDSTTTDDNKVAYPTGRRSLGDLVGVDEAAFKTWYEEAETSIGPRGHVKDPYHRVDVVNSDRHVQIFALDGTLLADTKNSVIVFETGLVNRYYLQRKDVINADAILSKDLTGLTTVCPYKGVAEYHDSVYLMIYLG